MVRAGTRRRSAGVALITSALLILPVGAGEARGSVPCLAFPRFWSLAPSGEVDAPPDRHFGDLGGRTGGVDPVAIAVNPGGNGYWIAEADGMVTAFGDVSDYGDLAGLNLVKPIVDLARTAGGLLLVGADGGVFALGATRFHGSAANLPLFAPIVSIAAHGSGGYWLAGRDGGVFAFGDAPFLGSLPQLVSFENLAAPVRSIIATGTGNGYWLLGEDGGVFTFGDAEFFGAVTGNQKVQHSDPWVSLIRSGNYGYALLHGGGAAAAFGIEFSFDPPEVQRLAVDGVVGVGCPA